MSTYQSNIGLFPKSSKEDLLPVLVKLKVI